MVLVDFYNLELNLSKISEPNWRTPEADRPKIMAFFAKHAPEVLKYQTAAEIEAIPKPVNFHEIIGTLGGYELREKQNWFDSIDAVVFYRDSRLLREVVDTYLPEHKITKKLLEWVADLGEKEVVVKLLKDKEEERIFTIEEFPEEAEINLERYTYLEELSPIIGRWKILAGELIADLHNELLKFLNGEIEVRKCEADDCDKIFTPAPQGKKQRYCSSQCRKRAWAQNHIVFRR
jgi:hypothetical protein